LRPPPARAGDGWSTPTSAEGLTYLAARRSEARGGIAAFDRLVWQVMTKEPYASARRVFWIVDNGSSHRGQKSVQGLQGRWPNLVLVHSVHASWLTQIEIYFSIVQRKMLEPNDFDDLAGTLNAFERRWTAVAEPFDWNFTSHDLAKLIERLSAHEPPLRLRLVRCETFVPGRPGRKAPVCLEARPHVCPGTVGSAAAPGGHGTILAT